MNTVAMSNIEKNKKISNITSVKNIIKNNKSFYIDKTMLITIGINFAVCFLASFLAISIALRPKNTMRQSNPYQMNAPMQQSPSEMSQQDNSIEITPQPQMQPQAQPMQYQAPPVNQNSTYQQSFDANSYSP